jgi:hypothetical protein
MAGEVRQLRTRAEGKCRGRSHPHCYRQWRTLDECGKPVDGFAIEHCLRVELDHDQLLADLAGLLYRVGDELQRGPIQGTTDIDDIDTTTGRLGAGSQGKHGSKAKKDHPTHAGRLGVPRPIPFCVSLPVRETGELTQNGSGQARR